MTFKKHSMLWIIASGLPLCATGCATTPSDAIASDAEQPNAMVLSDPLPDTRSLTLANGMRIVIHRRDSHDPGLGVVMGVAAGFIDEQRPGERGHAHLIEHLAFHGSTNLPRGRFQELGYPISVPELAVASTIWDRTLYPLSARASDLESLDTTLFLLREIASELTFPNESIAEQKTAVMVEMADRAAGNRTYGDFVRAVAPGSPTDIIDRQNSDDVPAASPAALRSLYEDLYRPQSTVLVIVGAIDPGEAERLVRSRFADWTAPAGAGRDRSPVTVELDAIRSWSVQSNPEGWSGVLLSATTEVLSAAPSQELWIERQLMDRLMQQALLERVRQAPEGDGPPLAHVVVSDGSLGFRQVMLVAPSQSSDWRHEMRRLTRASCSLSVSGLSDSEWERAKGLVLRTLRAEAAAASDLRNHDVALRLVNASLSDTYTANPGIILAAANEILPRLDPEAAMRWWQDNWIGGRQHVRIELPETEGVTREIGQALNEAACAS